MPLPVVVGALLAVAGAPPVPQLQNEVRRIWKETGRTILFVTHSIEEAVAVGTTLVMMSARPSRVRELIRNDGRVERGKLMDDLNTMIMEEVLRQQGGAPLG